MIRRPRILISAGQEQHTDPYGEAVYAAGGEPVVRRPSDGIAAYWDSRPDGMILAGGASINPSRYGSAYEAGVVFEPEEPRDQIEFELLSDPLASKFPVLGICRGQQLLNVFHGGTLWQHLPDRSLADDHWPEGPRTAIAHTVTARSGRLAEVLGTASLPVNSIHLQAIRDLAPGLIATVFTDDGLIEGIESADGRIIAVQWHPEELAPFQPESSSIFTDLITRALVAGSQPVATAVLLASDHARAITAEVANLTCGEIFD